MSALREILGTPFGLCPVWKYEHPMARAVVRHLLLREQLGEGASIGKTREDPLHGAHGVLVRGTYTVGVFDLDPSADDATKALTKTWIVDADQRAISLAMVTTT